MVTKGLCVRGELDTEQTATYWPPVPLSLAALLSRSAGLLNRGSIALSWILVLSTASYRQLYWLQLTELPVALGYIIVWRPPASCECRICTQFNLSIVEVIPWYLQPAGSICYTSIVLKNLLSAGFLSNTICTGRHTLHNDCDRKWNWWPKFKS